MRAFYEVAARRLQIAGERLIGAEHQMQRPGQYERRLAVDQRQWRVGGEADYRGIVGIADVIAAERTMRQRLAVIAGRPHADGDARQPGERLDDAVELRRSEHATELAEPRREIRDLYLGAVTVSQDGGNNRAVTHILRLIVHHVLKQDIGETLFFAPRQ